MVATVVRTYEVDGFGVFGCARDEDMELKVFVGHRGGGRVTHVHHLILTICTHISTAEHRASHRRWSAGSSLRAIAVLSIRAGHWCACIVHSVTHDHANEPSEGV